MAVPSGKCVEILRYDRCIDDIYHPAAGEVCPLDSHVFAATRRNGETRGIESKEDRRCIPYCHAAIPIDVAARKEVNQVRGRHESIRLVAQRLDRYTGVPGDTVASGPKTGGVPIDNDIR